MEMNLRDMIVKRRNPILMLLLGAILSAPLPAAGQGEIGGEQSATVDPAWQAEFEAAYTELAEEEQIAPTVRSLVFDRLPPEARAALPEEAARLALRETLRAEELLRRGEPTNQIALEARNRLRRQLVAAEGNAAQGSGARVQGRGQGGPPAVVLPDAASNRAVEILRERRGPRTEPRGRGAASRLPAGVSAPGRGRGPSDEEDDEEDSGPPGLP